MKYKVPVTWTMMGEVEVEGNDLEHAAQIAETDMAIGLPEGDYLEGSWQVDWQMINGKIIMDKVKAGEVKDPFKNKQIND